MPFEIKVTLTPISQTDLKPHCCVSQRLFMPEWKALNVGVESKDVAQDQNPKFVRVNAMSIWAKLQNTEPLLKRVSLKWLGHSMSLRFLSVYSNQRLPEKLMDE